MEFMKRLPAPVGKRNRSPSRNTERVLPFFLCFIRGHSCLFAVQIVFSRRLSTDVVAIKHVCVRFQ
jgi:hypothetical protein